MQCRVEVLLRRNDEAKENIYTVALLCILCMKDTCDVKNYRSCKVSLTEKHSGLNGAHSLMKNEMRMNLKNYHNDISLFLRQN